MSKSSDSQSQLSKNKRVIIPVKCNPPSHLQHSVVVVLREPHHKEASHAYHE